MDNSEFNLRTNNSYDCTVLNLPKTEKEKLSKIAIGGFTYIHTC